jgi:2-polyprenyl-6-hydroxyphenyl methylase/3-demethylubiquinone-9 3-methyltransferase
VGTVEDLARQGEAFDAALTMEVVEHVADVRAFVAAAASLVRPGGLLALSTLNRTLKSFALAIVGAEYALRWLAPGTHRWEQFVTPDELAAALRAAGLRETERRGLSFDPLSGEWRLSRDLGVNYLMAARKG